jgi:DNA modification methylase
MTPYYEESGITIYYADCRDLLPTLPKLDLVLTDPPYGINENPRKIAAREQLAKVRDYGDFAWDKRRPGFIPDVIATARSSIIFGGNFYNLPPASCWLVWDKDNSGDFADCELAWSNLKGAVRKFRWRWNGMLREPGEPKEHRYHPTQKPLPLMKWCLQIAKLPQTILDPFMGSGTTLRAAKDLGLSAIGIEIEERYCEIAANRLRQEVLNFEVTNGNHRPIQTSFQELHYRD